IPNHTQLWRPAARWMFSLFFLASTPAEAAFGFVLCGLVFLGLLIGWKTKLFQALSLVATVSLHSRGVILENGGDVVTNLLVAWTLFLPLGRRFSVDALLASLRRGRERVAADLAERDEKDTRPVVSLAVLGVLLQLAVIYLFNALHKSGATWQDGTVVHYVLHQDRIVTWLGEAFRGSMPLGLGKVLAWASLATEAAAPVLILSPVATVSLRRIAMVALPAMHIGFALFMNVGFFSPVMCTFFLLLPSARDWELAGAWARRASRARTVYFDASCGICFQTVRLLARLDLLHRLEFRGNDGELPPGVTPELVEKTIVVVDAGGRQTTRAAAFASIFRAIPGGFLIACPLSVPGLRHVADAVYDQVAKNRTSISSWLGLAACGLPIPGEPTRAPEPAIVPAVASARRAGAWVREAAVVFFILATGSQLLIENRAIPSWMKVQQPEVFRAFIAYGRFFQGWSMFAPNAPTRDGMVVVDARTKDGRRIDPYNLVASSHDGPPGPWDRIPGRLGQDQFWCDYTNRIKGNGAI
ncbi:MAG TPA: DCC1-like thiol-disulfide oxidoreductase family protein, partial [Vulgatibacter sp.]